MRTAGVFLPATGSLRTQKKRVAVSRDVQAFALFVLGDPQTDHDIDEA
jgi:hypothetical protein